MFIIIYVQETHGSECSSYLAVVKHLLFCIPKGIEIALFRLIKKVINGLDIYIYMATKFHNGPESLHEIRLKRRKL